MFSFLLVHLLALAISALSQSISAAICVPGQCMQGFSQTLIGAKISVPSLGGVSIHLLPGQYSSQIDPHALREALNDPATIISPSAGFENSSSTLRLPLNVGLQSGLATYTLRMYSGVSSFAPLPNAPVNSSTPLTAGSLALSSDVWAVFSVGDNRFVLWDPVPDLNQLPATAASTSISLHELQSSACSPACSAAGLCAASGKCVCPSGFTGDLCESCAPGFFGPSCQPCPDGCTACDEGISGSGRCLSGGKRQAQTCNCLHGICAADGQCRCNVGWVNSSNGTACAQCDQGFFLSPDGNCRRCKLGCARCVNGSGCTVCKDGFFQDPSDKTNCLINRPDRLSPCTGSHKFQAPSGACSSCADECGDCVQRADNCITCAPGRYMLEGKCVPVDSNGICQGSSQVADNALGQCNTCAANCTTCRIPDFGPTSNIDRAECTGCLPGLILSNGKCFGSCPPQTFLAKDSTCTACQSPCATCDGAPDFCLTCTNGLISANGTCVVSCPANSFQNARTNVCTPCHPDCASCSGPDFNQCTLCPSNRPVHVNGRCLPTCGRTEYFDKTSSTCQACHPSCASCSEAGPTNCFACSSPTQILRRGTCVDAGCSQSAKVVAGLGVCLSQLISTNASAPKSPTGGQGGQGGQGGPGPQGSASLTTRRGLRAWQIALVVLCMLGIICAALVLWRRYSRMQRERSTAEFADAKALSWLWLGSRLRSFFGGRGAGVGGDSNAGGIEGGVSGKAELPRMSTRSIYSRPSIHSRSVDFRHTLAETDWGSSPTLRRPLSW